jgi:hypothetical protein
VRLPPPPPRGLSPAPGDHAAGAEAFAGGRERAAGGFSSFHLPQCHLLLLPPSLPPPPFAPLLLPLGSASASSLYIGEAPEAHPQPQVYIYRGVKGYIERTTQSIYRRGPRGPPGLYSGWRGLKSPAGLCASSRLEGPPATPPRSTASHYFNTAAPPRLFQYLTLQYLTLRPTASERLASLSSPP